MNKIARWRLWASALALVSWVAWPQAAPEAKPRKDMDGKRLGAHLLALGEEHKDSLDPPEDEVDWLYVKVGKAGQLQVRVDGGESRLVIQLTDASGGKLQTAEGRGVLSVSVKAEPGIYYVEVSAPGKAAYVARAQIL
jgi:dipeptidyl aminopeptidase/acylaminoacyl peptidase